MTRIGHRTGWLLPALAVLAAAFFASWMWGFTVDDALISIRYARHLESGAGYVFNVGGPRTDGVTPLPWPLILAPFAHGDPLTILMRAKCMGLAAWLLAVYAWARAVARAPAHDAVKAIAVGALALCIPLAAHAVSGMETALATMLATLAAVSAARPMRAAFLAGVAASLRPEMAPWAIAIAAGFAWTCNRSPLRIAGAAAIAIAPFAICVAVREACFGHPAPLALLAKPSDLSHGLAYAGAAALATLAPTLAACPIALLRAPRPARILAAAGTLHFAVIVAVGGDWMPYARLAVPIAPSLLLAFVLAAPHAHRAATAARAVAALGLGAYLLVVAAPAGRHVGADRARLIEAARPLLTDVRSVAALDIGWPTAAAEITVIDLAGLTDPTIAALPGGHTSKRVDPVFLLNRAPDALLFRAQSGVDAASLAAWRDATYAYTVEARLARSDLIADRFSPVAFLPLGESGGGYVLLRRRAPAP